jgi:asparagine synthase (glutamine-hydrolysing)
MCGITGVIDLNGHPIEDTVFDRMLEKLIHRGPDEAGHFVDSNFALGIRRLKVVALENGSQPCFSTNKQYVIVFNGEIYNFKILRDQLRGLGYQFNTGSDAEVIVNLYQQYGSSFCDYLEGMFAAAIYNRVTGELILARDPTGKKPLFFANHAGRVYFSSELDSLLCATDLPRDLNYSALDYYLRFRVIPSDESIFKVIQKVPPGTFIRFNSSGVTVTRYWQVEYREDISKHNIDECVDELDSLLTAAVETRLAAEVPVGTMLSGGLDSSLVTAIACRLKPGKLHTFSVGFNEAEYNELAFARSLAHDLGTIHRDITITAQPALEAANRLIAHFGEPFAFPSSIACFFMYQLAAEDVTVVLGGDGADEVFGGYARYRLVQQFPDQLSLKDLPRQVELANYAIGHHEFDQLYQNLLTDGLTESLRTSLYSPSFLEQLEFCRANEKLQKRFSVLNSQNDPLKAAMSFDFNHWMPEAQLVKVDISSMANSLEVREPFLDRSVIQFGTSLSNAMKIHPLKEKYVLNKLAERYLPSYILNRKKQELSVPIDKWLVTSLRNEIVQTVVSEEALSRGYFKPDALRTFVQHADYRNSYALWTLYILEKWHRVFAI